MNAAAKAESKSECSHSDNESKEALGESLSQAVEVAASSPCDSDSENESWACVDCKCPLPWGSDWRQEDTSFYCKACYNDFDNRWWEFHTRDVLDSGPVPDERLQETPDAVTPGSPRGSETLHTTSVAGTVLVQLLQPMFSNLHNDSRLSGIDSLAVLTLCRQLRMAIPNLAIRPQDVFQCGTVRDLLSMVENVEKDTGEAELQMPEALGDTGVGRAIWFAPGQVKSTCKWLYGCRGLLDERCFKRAAAQLIARHEGLRAEFEDGAGMEILRFMRDVVPLHLILWQELEKSGRLLPMVRGCRRLISKAFRACWPRSVPQRVTASFLEDRIWVVRCKTWREVEQASHRLRQEWEPPFTLGLFLLEKPSEQERDILNPAEAGKGAGSPEERFKQPLPAKSKCIAANAQVQETSFTTHICFAAGLGCAEQLSAVRRLSCLLCQLHATRFSEAHGATFPLSLRMATVASPWFKISHRFTLKRRWRCSERKRTA